MNGNTDKAQETALTYHRCIDHHIAVEVPLMYKESNFVTIVKECPEDSDEWNLILVSPSPWKEIAGSIRMRKTPDLVIKPCVSNWLAYSN